MAPNRLLSLGLILVATTLVTPNSTGALPFEFQAQAQRTQPPPLPAEPALLKPAAVIKFIGVKHGLSDQQARLAFEQRIQLIIGQPLAIDLFDPVTRDGRGSGLVEWHSLDMNDCNEEKIRQLLDKFKNPHPNGYTREFKMEFGPEFDMPARVDFEWRNQCLAGYQKRTLDATPSSTTTTTTTTSTPETSTTAPEAPTTTTEAPMTTPAALSELSETPNATSETFATSTEVTTTMPEVTTPEFLTFAPMSDFNLTIGQPPATTPGELSTSTRESPTTTPESRSTSTETATSTETIISTEAPTTTSEIPATSAKAPITTPEVSTTTLEVSIIDSEEPETELQMDSLLSTTTPLVEESPAPNSSGASSSPHYGKYIGLTTGFFVFIAYLLCARAYRRQGMYELHEST